MLKIRLIQDTRMQHIVAIEKDGDLYCYYRGYSLHTACHVQRVVERDIARHGEDVVDLSKMPKIKSRTAKKSGRTVYEVEVMT